MNFHSDQWIMNRLNVHYNEVLNHYDEQKVVGIFYYGSGNYGLDTEKSDVDTKVIILPEFDEIVLGKQRINKKYSLDNGEQIEVKDIRDMVANIKKMNINFMEILFTDYCIINPKYTDLWKYFVSYKEEIARYDVDLCVKATVGMADEKFHALCLDRPSQHEEIEKYGWSTKQLHHIIRLEDFLWQYTVKENPYKTCLKPVFYGFYLNEIKLAGHEIYNKEEAVEVAEDFIKRIKCLRDNFISKEDRDREKEGLNKQEIDKVCYNFLKDCLMRTLKDDIEDY